MGLFDFVKSTLSPVSVEIDCPRDFSRKKGAIQGHVRLTASGCQQVGDVTVMLVAKVSRPSDSPDPESEEIVAKQVLNVPASPLILESATPKALAFSLPVPHAWKESSGESTVAHKVVAYAAVGLITAVDFLQNGPFGRDVSYEVVATVDVLGTKLDPKVSRWVYDGE